MTMVISGSGTITGLTAGGLPDATVTQPDLAAGVAGNGPAFSASLTGTQSVSSATWTKVQYATENWDTNLCYDTSTYRFTPNIAGYYSVTAGVDGGLTGSLTRSIPSIYRNGSLYRLGTNIGTGAAYATPYSGALAGQVYLNGSTDYIEIYAYVEGTSPAIAASVATWFDAVLVRAA